jgi:drug/metabolite transporter (DMT)-like permease
VFRSTHQDPLAAQALLARRPAYHGRVPALSHSHAYVALLLIVALWGSYPATAKVALRDVPPVIMVAIRAAIASAFLVVLMVRSGEGTIAQITPAALRSFAVLALTGVVGSMQLTYLSLYYTSATNVVILQVATPVMVAVGARTYLGERLARLQWLGVILSASGVLLVITRGRLANLRPAELQPGDLINLASMVCWSAYTVYGKRVLATYSPALATTAAYVLGTLVLIPLAVITAPLFPAPHLGSTVAWLVILYQALLGAVAHVWWYRTVNVVGPSLAAVFMNLQPVVGLALAALLLAEGISVWQVAGGLLVLGGVALTTGSRLRSPGR